MKPPLKLLIIGLLLALTLQSQAVTRISNLNVPWNQGGIGDIRAVTPDQKYGFTFTTGTIAHQLDSVVFEHYEYPGSLQKFSVELYRVDGPPFFGLLPVSLVGDLENASIDPRPTQWPGVTSFVGYTSSTALILDPNTTYMIAATEPPDGLNETGLLFATLENYSTTGDWTVPGLNQTFGDSSGMWFFGFGSSYDLKLEINATPVVVPEPSFSILIFTFFGLLRARK